MNTGPTFFKDAINQAVLWDPPGPNERMDCQTEKIHIKKLLKLCIKDLHPHTAILWMQRSYKIKNPN